MSVRTYPDLSATCLRRKLDLPLRLWYLLRPANGGRGWLTLDDIFDLSCGNERQTRAWLKAGMGKFWTFSGGRYWLAGLGALCEALDVIPYKSPVNIPKTALGSLGKFRAHLFASWFAGAGDQGRVISQAALAETFGKTARTLYNYAQTSGLTVKPNLATAPFPDQDNLDRYPTVETLGREPIGKAKPVKEAKAEPSNNPNLVWVERLGGKLVLCWGMPNTYISETATGPKTTLQRLAQRKARSALGRTAARANPRLYWRKAKKRKGKKRTAGAIARTLQSNKRAFFETTRTHPKTGAMLWHFVGV